MRLVRRAVPLTECKLETPGWGGGRIIDAPRPGKPAKYDETTERRNIAPVGPAVTVWVHDLDRWAGGKGAGRRSGAPSLAGLQSLFRFS